jgi:hypothetical protein
MPALLFASGCIFDTRDPDPPSDGQEIPYENPTEPRIVLSNTKATLELFSSGNYINALLPDFTVTPAPIDEADWQGRTWTVQQEQSATDAILAAARGTIPDQTRDAGTGPGGERQEYYENLGYEIVFTQGAATVTYSGKANLYFREDAGIWRIYDWIDLEDGSGHPTWGRLRLDNGPVFP